MIETHLVNYQTWTETTKLFTEENGERSEKTLKRIQSRALKKMVDP